MEQLQEVLEEQITKILEIHNDLNYAEVYEVLQDFVDEIPEKIKETTKIKRLKKFVNSEFGLDEEFEFKGSSNRKYDFASIPKYLFQSKKIKTNQPIINIKNLYKSIGATNLFENANCKIFHKDKISIIGKNGAGKTTLLKMIINKEEIDDGEIQILSNLKIGYLSQDLFWNDENNSLEQEMLLVFPSITEKIKILEQYKKENNFKKVKELSEQLRQIDGFRKYDLQLDILKYFGFTKEQLKLPVKKLSGGEQTKVQIAKFLIQQVDILILDEPTNHLDIEGIIFLEEFCQNWDKTIITISHDIEFINAISDKILEISNKKITIYEGNYKKYIEQKEKNYEIQLKMYNQQQKELEKQQEYINRFRAKASKAASVQSRIKQLDKIEIIEKPENDLHIKSIKIVPSKHLPEMIFKLENLQVGYKEVIVQFPTKLEVHKKDKIGIIGKNGVGKTTILKTILGEIKPLLGNVEISNNIKVGSYSQILEGLNYENNILQELLNFSKSEKEIRNLLASVSIVKDKVQQKISTLSGGERAKVGLVKMLLTNPDIIIMDEPTNHLDIYAKEMIKKMLLGFTGPIIIVSHDRDFLQAISNQIWLIKDKQLTNYHNIEKAFENLI